MTKPQGAALFYPPKQPGPTGPMPVKPEDAPDEYKKKSAAALLYPQQKGQP